MVSVRTYNARTYSVQIDSRGVQASEPTVLHLTGSGQEIVRERMVHAQTFGRVEIGQDPELALVVTDPELETDRVSEIGLVLEIAPVVVVGRVSEIVPELETVPVVVGVRASVIAPELEIDPAAVAVRVLEIGPELETAQVAVVVQVSEIGPELVTAPVVVGVRELVTVREVGPVLVVLEKENVLLLEVLGQIGTVPELVVPAMDALDPVLVTDVPEVGAPILIVIDETGIDVTGLVGDMNMDCTRGLAGIIRDGTVQTGDGGHLVPTGDITGHTMGFTHVTMAGITDLGVATGEVAGTLLSSGVEQSAGDWGLTPQGGVRFTRILTISSPLQPMSSMTMHNPLP